jgi:flagellar export protein FliJ
MKKFQFRLEALERHRKLLEQERQLWLSKCIGKMRATEEQLFELDKKEVGARREFSGLGNPARGKDATPARFWMLDQFIQGQKIRRIELKTRLQMEEQEVAQAYRDFLRARQQRKIMERLREKRMKQFLDEHKKQDLRNMDAQYVMRARLGEEATNEE